MKDNREVFLSLRTFGIGKYIQKLTVNLFIWSNLLVIL